MDIEDFRREYLQGGLQREDLRDDPVEQFESWLSQAVAGGITDPTAMVLATVDHLMAGEPSMATIVLGAMSAFVAWGRFSAAPIAAR